MLSLLACWVALSVPTALFAGRVIRHADQHLSRHLADRSRAFRQVGFDIPHGGNL